MKVTVNDEAVEVDHRRTDSPANPHVAVRAALARPGKSAGLPERSFRYLGRG